ncbi:MAG: tetratricopeptide repeat protein [Pseudomonadota bacterium]
MKDRYDNTLSTTSDKARDAYVKGVDHILEGTWGGVAAFENAVDADQGFALAHAGLARARMYAGDMAGAKAAISVASDLAPGTRETAHVGALHLLLSGNPVGARKAVDTHVRDYPRDALVAQMNTNVFGLIGFSGCAGREDAMLDYTSRLRPHYGDDWWMMSMHSLSLCETGQPEAALDLMEQSLSRNPRNANGAHFKAHEQYELGETQAGLDYLSNWLPGLDQRSVLHGHIAWHVGLWALATGDMDRLWSLVDDAIAPSGSQGLPINIVTDTVAILFRAELAGHAVTPTRWHAMSNYAAKTFPNAGQSFVDLHATLAHAMAGQGARLAPYLEAPNGYASALLAPVARAWVAFAAGAWDQVTAALQPVMDNHAPLGGSRAQRDLLELAYAHALAKGRDVDAGRAWLTGRRPVLMADEAPLAALH